MDKKRSTRPITLFGYAVIFLAFGVLGGWAAVAKLDSAIVAPGTVALDGNSKVVQHLEGGIVEEILVAEADVVSKGDTLLVLRDVEASSNLRVLETRLRVARITETRALAERNMQETFKVPEELVSEDKVLQTAIATQEGIFRDRADILKSQLEIQENGIESIKVQIKGYELQQAALEKRIANYDELMERMSRGQKMGLIQKNILSERQDEFIQIESELGQIIAQIGQARTSIEEIKLQSLQTKQQFRERANSDLEQIRAEISELQQRVNITGDVLERTRIVAPSDGTILNLQVHTVGSVIRPGEVLMYVVPEDDKLVINARVSPTDADNVAPGLKAEVRFSGFKSRLTPIVLGEVESMSQDVIAPSSPNELPYYLARIRVEEQDIPEDIRGRLTAGMPADIVIAHGERTVAYYLVSPLTDAIRKSLLEE